MKQNKNALCTLIVVETCNLRCKYCYVNDSIKLKPISKDVIDATFNWFEKLLETNVYDSIHANLFGGEPLLAWDSCKYIIEKGLELEKKYMGRIYLPIYTNLTLLTPEITEYVLSKPSITKFNVSLDGCKEAHDSARVYKDGTGSYDQVVKNIKYLSQFTPLDKINFKSVISSHNYQYLIRTIEEMSELGFKFFNFSFARDDIWDKNSIEGFKKHFKLLGEFFIEHINDGLWIETFSVPINEFKRDKKKGCYCSAGRTQFSITPFGDIYPCQRFYNNRSPYKMGTVFTGIESDNKWTKVFNNYTLDNMIGCNTCDKFKVSKYNCSYGGCLAAQYESSGNLFKPIPSVCDLIDIINEVSWEIYDKLKDNENYKKMLNRKR